MAEAYLNKQPKQPVARALEGTAASLSAVAVALAVRSMSQSTYVFGGSVTASAPWFHGPVVAPWQLLRSSGVAPWLSDSVTFQ